MNKPYIIFLIFCYCGCANAQKQRGYPALAFGVGIEASHLLSSKTWTSDDSYGFRQGMGLDFELEYRFNARQSVVLATIYQRWGVQRQYFDMAGTLSKKATTALSVVPVGIGYKYRLGQWLYLMPDVNVAFQNGTQTDTLNQSVTNKQTALGLGLSGGLEKSSHRYCYDVSFRYGYLSSAFGVGSAWQYLSVRLAVSWQTGSLRRVSNKCYYN
jgi:hypothetical protein